MSQRSRSLSSASTCTLDFEKDIELAQDLHQDLDVIEAESEHCQEAEVFEIFDDEVIDLTVDEGLSDGVLKPGEIWRSTTRIRNDLIQRGDFVEIVGTCLGKYPVEFLQVKAIVERPASANIVIRGVPFTRTRNLKGQLQKKINEVCMLLHYQRDDTSLLSQTPILVDADRDSFLRKRELLLTNEVWPVHRVTVPFSESPTKQNTLDVEQNAALVCRWKMEVYFTLRGRQTCPSEESLRRIHFSDVKDTRHQVSEDVLSNRWRGHRIRGGSHVPGGTENIDLEIAQDQQQHRQRGQKYTVFDSFAGAGGVSRGATSAGYKIQYAVDKSSEVWPTYRVNFSAAKLYRMSIDEFIFASRSMLIRVDVLHLSPPCQYFSPAHTHQAAHDDTNIFALFGCNELIKKLRPRLVTLEQTFGVTHERHAIYFRALVGDFTQLGYSVRWKIVRLKTWGSFQDRKRLIMIAAAPGERLPPFPTATHSEGGQAPGTKPFATIRQALSTILPGDDLHDVKQVRHHNPRRARYDANQLAMTMTTGGGLSHHPDGTRDFTIREYANIQGFPPNHRFVGTRTTMRRQIGNAFPPNTVRVLYSHLEEWLLKEDSIKRYQPPVRDIIMVEDGDTAMADGPYDSDRLQTPVPEMIEVIEVESPWADSPATRHHDVVVVDEREVIYLT